MGVGIVLLFWALVGTVFAAIGAATLGCATALLTRGVTNGRRKVVIAASLFPFVCLGWGGAMFVFQAVVNEGLLHRDLGLGDTWHAPLPNGYQIMLIDVTDQGWVYNPKTQPGSGVGEQEDAVAGVRNVQVAGRYILGATDSRAFEHFGKDINQVDAYFLLDTQLGKRKQFQNYDALRHSALELGIEPNLERIDTVYSKFRFNWFDVVAGLLFCLPPVILALLLIRRIVRLRRTRCMGRTEFLT
jgi:energy-coupling factor transporter transmembrane protein EcfT